MYTDELFERYLKENVLLTSEVGAILGVSKQQVSNLVKQGKIKPFKENANSSLFLKTNIDEYIATKFSNPMFRDNEVIGDGSTYRSQDHFSSIQELHKDIREVHLYFNKQDAIFDGYYCLDGRYQRDTLLRLDAPTCVLKLHTGEVIWYDGFNCGYGGTGPNGSYDLLVDLGVTDEVARKLFASKKISFYKEDSIWEAVDRSGTIANPEYPMADSDVCLFNGELVLVQNKPEKHRIETNCIEFIDRYSFFIPRPIEVIFYNREEAINTGHFATSFKHSAVYQVVIKDASGSEVWLDATVDEGQPINKQQNLESILKKVGISVPKDTESENYYLKDRVSEVVAIIELKYVNASNNDEATEQWIMEDIKKFKRYIQEGQLNAQFYFAVIYENERKRMNWMDQRSSKHWAKGRVTELDAAIVGEEMRFEVHSYNGYPT